MARPNYGPAARVVLYRVVGPPISKPQNPMQMSEYNQTKLAEIDHAILDRITLADVQMWMVAKMAALREAGLPIHDLALNVNFRHYCRRDEPYYDTSWSGHAAGACSLSMRTPERVAAELREEIGGNPREKARQARMQAEQLLRQAEALECTKV